MLPPGAASLSHFRSRCTACHLCVSNCPDQVLRPAVTEHGLAGFLQPYQDFGVALLLLQLLELLAGLPTGAIQPITVEERRLVRTGAAEFFIDRCVVNVKGTSCGACSEHCPTQAVHMIPHKNGLTIPEINADLCIEARRLRVHLPGPPGQGDRHQRPHRPPARQGRRARREEHVRKLEEEFPF
ncbi:MAG: 4Fe-4S dicluster domain-containing protein [Kiritimatiellia bacterium]